MHCLFPAAASSECLPGRSFPVSVARRFGAHYHQTWIVNISGYSQPDYIVPHYFFQLRNRSPEGSGLFLQNA
jgi:hypothetical protein